MLKNFLMKKKSPKCESRKEKALLVKKKLTIVFFAFFTEMKKNIHFYNFMLLKYNKKNCVSSFLHTHHVGKYLESKEKEKYT